MHGIDVELVDGTIENFSSSGRHESYVPDHRADGSIAIVHVVQDGSGTVLTEVTAAEFTADTWVQTVEH